MLTFIHKFNLESWARKLPQKCTKKLTENQDLLISVQWSEAYLIWTMVGIVENYLDWKISYFSWKFDIAGYWK